ncbi:MAG: trypsin-like peptidase domain-containing protein [Acidobacteria bacterium]|nr:trypsin-like peptidase domain-containing protein [Acidobacteriota bacterium]MBI3656683.1 trypsin-like peptidase domain-containing protein [Acidobacteriota bacterium]
MHLKLYLARTYVVMVIMMGLGGASPLAAAADEASVGRDIIKQWQNVVVTVKTVVKMRTLIEGREVNKTEDKVETAATVIDPSGLSILSLTAVNPGESMGRFMQMFGGDSKMKVESELSDVKMRLTDGQEIPAQIVLRDKDLDIAFVRPTEKPSKPFPALDLSVQSRPLVLDQVINLSRLGKVGSWAPFVWISRINAIIDKPRTFYVPGLLTEVGTPVFALDGKVIGIVLLRMAPAEGGSMSAMMRGSLSSLGILPVILPAEDVREVAKQVPTK